MMLTLLIISIIIIASGLIGIHCINRKQRRLWRNLEESLKQFERQRYSRNVPPTTIDIPPPKQKGD